MESEKIQIYTRWRIRMLSEHSLSTEEIAQHLGLATATVERVLKEEKGGI